MFEFRRTKYVADKSLAIMVYENGEPYAKLTVCAYPDVNIRKQLKDNYMQFVDINNLERTGIVEQLENENKITRVQGVSFQPGFVSYPLYKFNKEWVDSLKESL